MLSIVCGLAGAACCVGVWNAVDRSETGKVAGYGAAALLLFLAMAFSADRHTHPGSCYTDWDGRSNSEVCD